MNGSSGGGAEGEEEDALPQRTNGFEQFLERFTQEETQAAARRDQSLASLPSRCSRKTRRAAICPKGA